MPECSAGKPEPNATAESDRDELGRWRPGNKASVGLGGAASAMARFRLAVLEAITPAQAQALAQRVYALAMEGDVMAAALVFDRLLGKARPPEPETDDNLARMRAEAERWVLPPDAVRDAKIAELERELAERRERDEHAAMARIEGPHDVQVETVEPVVEREPGRVAPERPALPEKRVQTIAEMLSDPSWRSL